MLDQNNINTLLTLDAAQAILLALAESAGVDVESGSVEEELNNLWAQFFVQFDTSLTQIYQLEFNPVGSDIDLQNPGTPRLPAQAASGYIALSNPTVAPITVNTYTIGTAPNGNTYSTLLNTVTVSAKVGDVNGFGTIPVMSTVVGINSNLAIGQTLTGFGALIATNPQPFTDGRDIETDTQYLDRLIYLQSNNSSQQASVAAQREFLEYYQAARIYVNDSSDASPNPLPIPPNGYVAVIQVPSGPTASAAEIQNALQILANRFEFDNTNESSSANHPTLGGTIYSGSFPEQYFFAPVQMVKSTLNCTCQIAFAPNVDESEKLLLANAFGQFFAQNIIDVFAGSAGNCSVVFQALGSPMPDPVTSSVAVITAQGIFQQPIAPVFTVELIRALIADENNLAQLPNLEYVACTALSYLLDTQVDGEPTVELNISGAGGTVMSVNFTKTALFYDGTSWYDRRMYQDPALITITLNEVTQ